LLEAALLFPSAVDMMSGDIMGRGMTRVYGVFTPYEVRCFPPLPESASYGLAGRVGLKLPIPSLHHSDLLSRDALKISGRVTPHSERPARVSYFQRLMVNPLPSKNKNKALSKETYETIHHYNVGAGCHYDHFRLQHASWRRPRRKKRGPRGRKRLQYTVDARCSPIAKPATLFSLPLIGVCMKEKFSPRRR
jgi:hypothetical protein